MTLLLNGVHVQNKEILVGLWYAPCSFPRSIHTHNHLAALGLLLVSLESSYNFTFLSWRRKVYPTPVLKNKSWGAECRGYFNNGGGGWKSEPTLESHPLITIQAFNIFAEFHSETPASTTGLDSLYFPAFAATPNTWLGTQMFTDYWVASPFPLPLSPFSM